jgi:3-phosphoshikimate 1-carboxyvinyltransferase
MLRQLGVDAYIEKDDMFITGHSLSSRLLNGNLLAPGEYTSRHDHRMVMALKVAQLGAAGPITIDDTLCVAKSFPDFYL